MEKGIILQWKAFSIPMDKLNSSFRLLIGSNYDGLICNTEDFYVTFKEVPTQQEIDTVNTYWSQVTQEQFNPSLREIISGKINDASVFGRTLILDAAVENVEMGITQAGKTREVADYCADVQRYLESGSLYAALSKIEEMISLGVPQNLAPFITEERLLNYKSKIEAYLQI